jgi:hypothetical protein
VRPFRAGWLWLIIPALASLLWLLVPSTDVVSPDWEVLVTDTSGHPIQSASVTVSEQQYTLESADVQKTAFTDRDGRVSFARREIRANGLARLTGGLRNIFSQGAHASFGAYTFLHASKEGYGDPGRLSLFHLNEPNSRANGSARQTSHIVLMQCPAGYSGQGCSFPDDPDKPIRPLDMSD